MAAKRPTGPRIAPRPGPHITTAQPDAPTTVYAGGDRILVGAREIDVSQLAPDPEQPRKYMDPDRLAELAASITRDGVLQALLVREEGMGRDGDMRYAIIAGGRRYAAIQLALAQALDEETRRRLARVPVVVRDTEAAERRVLQLVENLQREELPPVEEARALKELMQLEDLTTTGVARRIHRSQGYVDERLRLIRHDDVATAVEAGVIPSSAAAAVASIGSADERRDWIERAQAGETIRPREVYASKPDRRRGRQTSSKSNPNVADAALGQTITSAPASKSDTSAPQTEQRIVQDAPDALSRPTKPAMDTPLPNFGNEARPPLDWARTGTPANTGAAAGAAILDPTPAQTNSHAAVHALLSTASSTQRAFAEHLVGIGADQGWSCVELIRQIRGDA